MAIVDRNVLRLAVYEFLHEPTPRTVTINEALEIARRFSTYEATQFINGILDAIKRDLDESFRTANCHQREELEDDDDASAEPVDFRTVTAFGPNSQMNDLQHQFVTDAEELVEKLFRALQQLRVRQSVGRIRRQLTGKIFRQVHTLKGSAGAAEKDSISRLAHEFESVLDGVRLGRIGIDDAVLDTFEDAAHAISEMLSRFRRRRAGIGIGRIARSLAKDSRVR